MIAAIAHVQPCRNMNPHALVVGILPLSALWWMLPLPVHSTALRLPVNHASLCHFVQATIAGLRNRIKQLQEESNVPELKNDLKEVGLPQTTVALHTHASLVKYTTAMACTAVNSCFRGLLFDVTPLRLS